MAAECPEGAIAAICKRKNTQRQAEWVGCSGPSSHPPAPFMHSMKEGEE